MTQTAPTAALTDADLDRLEAGIRAHLGAAIADLTALREAAAHQRRGFPTWHDYVLDRFGDLLRDLRLPKRERDAMVASMSGSRAEGRPGISTREQAELLGIPSSTVGDIRRRVCDPADLPDNVIDLRGHRRPARPAAAPAAEQAPAPRTARVLALLAERGPLNAAQIAEALRWERHIASATLTRLAAGPRLTYRRAGKRGTFGTYALPE